MFKLEFIQVSDSRQENFHLTTIYSVLNLYFKLTDIFYYLGIKDWTNFTKVYVNEMRYYSTFNLDNTKMDVATLFVPVNTLYVLLKLVKCDPIKLRDLFIYVEFLETKWKLNVESSILTVLGWDTGFNKTNTAAIGASNNMTTSQRVDITTYFAENFTNSMPVRKDMVSRMMMKTLEYKNSMKNQSPCISPLDLSKPGVSICNYQPLDTVEKASTLQGLH